MIDGLVIWRDEGQTEEKLRQLFAFGATEVLASPIIVGEYRAASLQRTLGVLGKVAKAAAA